MKRCWYIVVVTMGQLVLGVSKQVILVHGAVLSPVARMRYKKTNRVGLYKAQHAGKVWPRLAQELSSADPLRFEEAYIFYWAGTLSLKDRKDAAELLLKELQIFKEPITVIAFSHGCSVMLHVGELCLDQDTSLHIEHLVLLAPPVQRATAAFINAPIFKKVYSCYSTEDIIQRLAVQSSLKEFIQGAPFFSERTFESAPHLVQARIKGLKHHDFITPLFFKQIPELLSILQLEHKKGIQEVAVCLVPDKGVEIIR